MAEIRHSLSGTVRVGELAPMRIATLRLRHPSSADLARIAALLGVALPGAPNTAHGDGVRAIWIGPDEWIIVGDIPAMADMEAAATDAVAALCVSVGDGRCVWDVTGPEAAELLAKGTSLDLHPKTFAPGDSALTLFAGTNVIIDRPPGLDGFRLYFDISMQHFLRLWFADALIEFA